MSEPLTAEEIDLIRQRLTRLRTARLRLGSGDILDERWLATLAAIPAPAGLPWAANGLAALDHLDSLYYADGLTVGDYRAATDAIRAALEAQQREGAG